MTAVLPAPRLDQARVHGQHEAPTGFFWLTLDFPLDYPEALPGQYLNLRVGSPVDPLFRRPFGVVDFRREKNCARVELFYAVVGEGTARMSRWRAGDPVDCLGPLGMPYRVDPTRPALLVAGGRGAAPLLYLNRILAETSHPQVRFAFGVRSQDHLFGLDRLHQDHLLIASEDGSVGFRGNVLEALDGSRPDWLEAKPALYACGPEALLAATARFAERHHLPAQVSLEGVYGCGLGLCRGCAVPLRGEDRYLMQCVEGPVIDAARVDWDRMPHE